LFPNVVFSEIPLPMTTALDSRQLYVRLLGYVRPHWRMFALAMLAMVAAALTEPLFPALMKPLLDHGFTPGQQRPAEVVWLPLAIVGIFTLRGMLGFFSSYALAWVTNKVVLDLRNAMFGQLVRLPTRFYDNQSSGLLISRIAYDVNNVTSAATSVLTVVVKESLTVVGLMAWLLWLNWQLTLVALTLIPIVGIVVRLFSKRLRTMARGSQFAMGDITHVIDESIGCHKVVKIYGGQQYEIDRFGHANAVHRGYSMRQTVAASATVPITQLFASVALAIVIALALNQSAANQTTVGGFVSFITAMLMLLAPLKQLADVNAPLQKGLAAAESVFSLLDEPAEADSGKIALPRAKGELAFEQVRFRYPTAERDALAGVDFTIAPGQTIALVGPSGSGKTTIAQLLPRFYSPSGGRICLDGHDIEELTLPSLRENIALVSQDVVLFNDSVAANIAYGTMRHASRAEIEAAAQAAHALEFINAMPQGFDTTIGENGVRLSGGQRQRLAIARAILKNAPVLILDEATSALDTESERQVQAALEELMKTRTTLVIAHRLSTIERADRILVLSHGRIAEAGSHAELLAHDGLYAQLYKIQFAERTSQ
jgi:subfamily B ATP-binding cassette protein MsbA